ncbi:MAG: phosphoribosylglycinamide formyltransferase [Lachnospiraceae bacterium]
MMKIGVLVSGGGTNLQAIIDNIEAGTITNASIACVISNNPGVYALERAAKHGIPGECMSPADYPDRPAYHRALIQRLKDYGVELVVLAGFLVNISPEMVAAFPNRIINIHPSLIPSFCGKGFYGLKVHEAALARGVKITGATVHFVDEGTDSGPIIMQKAVEIPEGISAKDLQLKVMQEAEWIILPAAIQKICSSNQ